MVERVKNVQESERQELVQFYHDAFASAMASGVYDDIEEIWMELTKLEADNTPNFIQMAAELKSRRKEDLAGKLLLALARIHRQTGNREGRLAVLKEAGKLNPHDEDVKAELADYYREVRADHPLVEDGVMKCGLLKPGAGVAESMAKLDVLLKFQVGDIVHHPTGWGMGTVRAIEIESETLTVDFEHRKNHSMGLEMAAKILERLPADNFRARKYIDIASLKAMADSAPEELLKLVLRDMGGKGTLKDVKSRLTDGIIDAGDWTRWWTVAKRAAMRDPYLNVSGTSVAAVFELRDRPVSHQEEIIDKLRAARTLDARITLIEEYTRNLKSDESAGDVLNQIARMLYEGIEGSSDAAAIVQTALVLDDLRGLNSHLSVPQVALDHILTPDKAFEVIDGIGRATHRRRVLLKLKELAPEQWTEVVAKLFFESGSDLWDFAAKELVDSKKHREATDAFSQILARFRDYPELYLWLCRSALMDKYPTVLGEHNKVDLIEKLLNLMKELARTIPGESKTAASDRKKLLSKARETIGLSDFTYLQPIVADSSEDEARRIYNAANACSGLTDTAREKVMDIVITEYPELMPRKMQKVEEDAILTTEDGLRRKQAEFDHMINVEIPENQEALRVAISFGDLSENAEYSAAREQQGILMRKAEHIKKELSMARLIEPSSVKDGVVGIGTAIEVRNTRSNKIEHYTILGPWDSDAERGIVSYLAPLAEAFIGRKVGDTSRVEFSETKDEYEILLIKKAI